MRKHGPHRQFVRPRACEASDQACQKRHWRPFHGRCRGEGGPRRFPTRALARAEQRTAAKAGAVVYRCDDCGSFHVCHFPARVLLAIELLEASLTAERDAALVPA